MTQKHTYPWMFHLWFQWQSYFPSSKKGCRRQEPGYRRLEILVSIRFTADSRWSCKAQPTFAIIGKSWKRFIDGRSANGDSQRFTCRRSHLGRFLCLNLKTCVHDFMEELTLSFPAATQTTTPDLTAAATARSKSGLGPPPRLKLMTDFLPWRLCSSMMY